jgi:hypothetical protein
MSQLGAEGYIGAVEVDDEIIDRCNGCSCLGSAAIRFCQTMLKGIELPDGTLVSAKRASVSGGADVVSKLCVEQGECMGQKVASSEANAVYT